MEGVKDMKKQSHSKVMTIANRLVAQGYNRANAMVKAWMFVKLPAIETKAAGVTFGKRQQALEHLMRYNPQDITVNLAREAGNAFDRNAVTVVAHVRGKGCYTVGYLPKAVAAFVAPLMDAGEAAQGIYKGVKGLYQPYMNYGLAIEVRI